MASKNFFRVSVDIRKPTQSQIELVRRRAIKMVKYARGRDKYDAKAVEAMLRIVSGRYSDLLSSLESNNRKLEQVLDSKFAQGVKEAKEALVKIEHDVRLLEDMGYDRSASGIDYTETLARLKGLSSVGDVQATRHSPAVRQSQATVPTSSTKRPVGSVNAPSKVSVSSKKTVRKII